MLGIYLHFNIKYALQAVNLMNNKFAQSIFFCELAGSIIPIIFLTEKNS